MTTFSVTEKLSNKEVYQYDNDVKIVWDQYPESTYDYAIVPAQEAPRATPIYGGRRLLTKNEFRKLFTFGERTLMDEFEDTYQSLGLPESVVRNLRTGYKDYANAQDINLDDPGVSAMLGALIQLGKLAAQRFSEVLNG
jgi:hypothetical protein